MGRSKLFSLYFRKRTVLESCGSFVQSSPGDRLSPEIHGSLFFSKRIYLELFLWQWPFFSPLFVMAKPEEHMVGREPVLPIAGELALAQLSRGGQGSCRADLRLRSMLERQSSPRAFELRRQRLRIQVWPHKSLVRGVL